MIPSFNQVRLWVVSLVFVVTSGLTSSAFVSFSFDYTGSTEFNDVTLGTARKASLESAASTVGSWFNHTATINMAVSSSNANTTTLASAGSNYSGSFAGFGNRGIVGRKILGEADPNGATADGTVNVNFFHNWELGDTVGGSSFDFKSTMMHELLHAAGFSSSITQAGADGFGNAAGTVGQWDKFDQFVADSTGSLIDGGFILNATRWNVASVGGAGTGLRFNGANALAANGGNPIFLYSKNPWADGSSGSHLDDDFYTSDNLMMESATTAGPGARTLSAIEIGMLQDIGYSVVPEPSTYALIMGCVLMSYIVFVRRQKKGTVVTAFR